MITKIDGWWRELLWLVHGWTERKLREVDGRFHFRILEEELEEWDRAQRRSEERRQREAAGQRSRRQTVENGKDENENGYWN